MVRAEWVAIATAIGEYRTSLAARRPKFENGMPSSTYWAAQMTLIDDLASVLCLTLKRRSSRFDARRFLALCGVG